MPNCSNTARMLVEEHPRRGYADARGLDLGLIQGLIHLSSVVFAEMVLAV